MTKEEAATCQQWQGMDGATAWHPIDRHADGWCDVGLMMQAWLDANCERLRHNLQVTEQTRQELEELAKLRLEEIERLREEIADLASLGQRIAMEITEEVREKAKEAVAEALGDAYDCTRVWSAWSYGTMGQADFSLVAEDDSRLAEIVDAVICALTSNAGVTGLAPEKGNK